KRFALLSLRVSAPPRETNLLRPLLAATCHAAVPVIAPPTKKPRREPGLFHILRYPLHILRYPPLNGGNGACR
ncbi:hypothetical protein, partial [Sphingobium jiangsuense]|uniref:hypothetical protein n=1 Tax=Sphingobium jiangsuense TaxID=870476 RepID=UPI0024E17E18